MHARKQIRDAVTVMVTGLQTTRANVFPSRVYSLDSDQLPSLSIFTGDSGNDELVSRITLGSPPKFHRVCPLIIEGHASAADDVDDLLDQISLEVEVAMSAVLTVSGKTINAQLISTSKELIGDAEDQIGIVRLLYTVPYVTSENTPDILE
jgi:galactitol-specific phosphotransferase system IIB component